MISMNILLFLFLIGCSVTSPSPCLPPSECSIDNGNDMGTQFAQCTLEDDRGIKQIAMLFRHGARNPMMRYKNDPHVNHHWDGGLEALTKEGERQLYKLGQWMRSQYDCIIGRKYHSDTLLVQSSAKERCIMSVQALLAGLFRPGLEDYIAPDLPWSPIPVFTVPEDQDRFFRHSPKCPKLDEALRQAFRVAPKDSTQQMMTFFTQLSNYTGQLIRTPEEIVYLHDLLTIEKQRGLALPDWANRLHDKMGVLVAEGYALYTSSTLQRRLRGGPLLKEITDHMMKAQKGEDSRKLYLYSGHDITLVNVLRTMGFTEQLFRPDHGAAIIFELVSPKSGGNEMEVKIRYLNNTEVDTAHPLQIPGCADPCKLTNLQQVWKDVLPVDWEAECK